MTYRNATTDDLQIIVDIYNASIPGRMVTADTEPVTVTDKLNWFHEHNHETRPLWMVEHGTDIIGWVSFQDFYGRPAYDGTAEISIYLHPAQQGKKYGKKILRYAIEQCPSLGIHHLLGFIFAHNHISLALFKQHGFTEWGHLEGIANMDGIAYSLKILGLKIRP